MPDYAIVVARSARKELEALDPPIVGRLIARIEALATDPRPSGSRKLRGSRNLWRVRVGDYVSSTPWMIADEWWTSSGFAIAATPTKSNSAVPADAARAPSG
jgi:hypothetical protein